MPKKKNKKKLKEIKVDQIIPDEVEMTGDRRISIKKTSAVGFTKSSLMKTIADNGGEVSYIKDKGEVKEVHYTPIVSGGAWC